MVNCIYLTNEETNNHHDTLKNAYEIDRVARSENEHRWTNRVEWVNTKSDNNKTYRDKHTILMF